MNMYQLLKKRTFWENWEYMGGYNKEKFKEIKLWAHTIAKQRIAMNTVIKFEVHTGIR
jgi:hypothetical protein